MNPNDDPVVLDDWHPVAASSAVMPGAIAHSPLLGRGVALWRGPDGEVRAWEDRCPHRGMRLSMGRIAGDELVCPYHGWRFDAAGQCVAVPAQPGFAPPARACARVFAVRERYGLVWVCAGTPARDVPPFPEHADPALRKVVCGPYEVASSGPRIVENFLDMAHFPFVHEGILGDASTAAISDYRVSEPEDGTVLATQCFAWQPQANSLSSGGSQVEYSYRVVRPLTAILTKHPAAQPDFREAISLHVQPVAPELSRAWIILAMTNFEQSDDALRAFQDRIFLQDLPIVQNQVPLRLPLDPAAEVSMACDRMSVAYRRYLARLGLVFGVVPGSQAVGRIRATTDATQEAR